MDEEGAGGVAVGDEAPDFTLGAARGGLVSLRDFRGQRSVLLFFTREFT